ncbi:MAG: hypothetical protein ACI4DY_08020 [Monoglobaceae bacterium]
MKKNYETAKSCEGPAKMIAKIGVCLAVIYTAYKVVILIHQHIGEFKCPFKTKAVEASSEDSDGSFSDSENEEENKDTSDHADE